MNIGEVSKPSVEGSQIKKKVGIQPTEPVTPTRKVSSLIDLSNEAKRQLKDEQQQTKKKKTSTQGSNNVTNEEQIKSKVSIDIQI